jgi:hypothetical protein
MMKQLITYLCHALSEFKFGFGWVYVRTWFLTSITWMISLFMLTPLLVRKKMISHRHQCCCVVKLKSWNDNIFKSVSFHTDAFKDDPHNLLSSSIYWAGLEKDDAKKITAKWMTNNIKTIPFQALPPLIALAWCLSLSWLSSVLCLSIFIFIPNYLACVYQSICYFVGYRCRMHGMILFCLDVKGLYLFKNSVSPWVFFCLLLIWIPNQ